MWTRKERIKHFWRCCSHLTRFLVVNFAVVGIGAAFVYTTIYYPDVIVYGLLGFVVVIFGGGSIWGLWILTDPD